MNNSKFSPPKPTVEDTAHRVKKALLSFIPGSVELYEYFITPPLEKRLEEWKKYVGEALYLLEQNLGFELEKLQANEKFVTVVVQSTRIAAQNHQKEKLAVLRNAVVSSALNPEISDDLQLIYIRYVDELTPSHLALLKFFVDNERKLKKLKSYPSIFDFVRSPLFKQEIALSRDEFKMLLGDLSVRSLIRISQDIGDFDDIYEASAVILEQTDDSLPRMIITQIAKDFIQFISETDFSKIKVE